MYPAGYAEKIYKLHTELQAEPVSEIVGIQCAWTQWIIFGTVSKPYPFPLALSSPYLKCPVQCSLSEKLACVPGKQAHVHLCVPETVQSPARHQDGEDGQGSTQVLGAVVAFRKHLNYIIFPSKVISWIP